MTSPNPDTAVGAWDTLEGAGLQEKTAIRQRGKGPKIQGRQLQGMKKRHLKMNSGLHILASYLNKFSEAQTLLARKPPDRSTNKGIFPSPTSPDSSPTCQTGSETPSDCPPEGRAPCTPSYRKLFPANRINFTRTWAAASVSRPARQAIRDGLGTACNSLRTTTTTHQS